MSPPLEDMTSSSSQSSSSSSSTTYLQNPNPNNNNNNHNHQTDSGIFTTFNFIDSNFNCSNDTTSFPDGRFSRRKYVKVKKHLTSDSNSNSNSNGFNFNLNLGQSSRNSGSDFNKLRFTFGANNDIKLGSDFVFGLGETTNKVSENGGSKFGKVSGVGFVFDDMKVESSGSDFVFGVGETTNKFGKVSGGGFVFGDNGANVMNSDLSNDVDSHLVDSLSGLNLGTGGLSMNDKRKTVENDVSDSGKSEKVGFLFPTDLSDQKEESKVEVDNLDSTKVKCGDTLDSGVVFGKGEFNGGFHFGNQNGKGSTVKGRKKLADKKMNSRRAESGCNSGFSFGSNLGDSFGETTRSEVSGETKTSVVNDPVKASTHSDNLFVFGSDKPNVSEPNPFLNTRFGFVSDVHNTEAHPTNGIGTTNNFSFASNVGLFGTSFTGFNTPDINLSTSFTSDMFPGFGKKLEFGKTPKKVKKTKLKSKHQGGRNEVAQSFEEAASCSPMDVSPYGVTDCASNSTNEDAVDTKENPGATNVSSLSSSFADLNVPARQRPHMKKYRMKTGRDIEFKTSKSRLNPSRAHETHTKASDEEICDKWRKRGNQAYKNGDLSEAEACYSKGISSIQHTETSGFCIEPLLLCYSNRAAARMALGRMREGLEDCRMAAALDPSFLKVNLRSANCHLLLGELEDACSDYNNCLESENIVCLDRRIAIDAADGLQKAQKVTDCLKLSAALLEQKTYESATKALGVIAEALSISCYSEKLLNMKGVTLFELGKHNEVVQLCEQTLDSAEKNIATGGVAGHTNADGYDCNSIKLWRWNLMSKSYFHLGKLEMALDWIDKHEQLRPAADKTVDSEHTLSSFAVTIRELLQCKNAGNVAFQSGKYAEAVEHYTAATSKSVKSHSFAAVCFCNRAAAHQSLGEIIDAIGDCSLAIALDRSYPKALSRRATLWEMIRDYKHATDDLQRLVSILETGENSQKSATPGRTPNGSVKDLRKARRRLYSIEEKAKKERSLDLYLILGVKPSDAAVEVKKAYRKAALRHHPDKAGQVLARAESGSDGQQWKLITESIQTDADKIFKMIGEAYAVLSDSTKRSKYDLEEEMWDDAEVTVASTSRRSSDFYSSPYDFSNRRYTHESRKSYNSYSHYYPWEDSRKTYQSSYRW